MDLQALQQNPQLLELLSKMLMPQGGAPMPQPGGAQMGQGTMPPPPSGVGGFAQMPMQGMANMFGLMPWRQEPLPGSRFTQQRRQADPNSTNVPKGVQPRPSVNPGSLVPPGAAPDADYLLQQRRVGRTAPLSPDPGNNPWRMKEI